MGSTRQVLALPAVLVATAFVIVFVLTLLSLFPLPALLCFGEVGFKASCRMQVSETPQILAAVVEVQRRGISAPWVVGVC